MISPKGEPKLDVVIVALENGKKIDFKSVYYYYYYYFFFFNVTLHS